MAKQTPISFIDFKNRFNSEAICREHLFQMRWPEGYICPKCGHKRHYLISTRNLYECTDCHYQASVTVGTVLEKTHLSLETWFWAIYFIGNDKRGISAMLLSTELEISYKAAWLMIHKIRKAMGEQDSKYKLAGVVELDDSFFGAPDKGGKRGRGTSKTKVVVGVSLDTVGRP